VECRSEFAYAERPAAVWWQGRRLEVQAVEAEWRIPQGKKFRVRCEDSLRFDLVYNENSDDWTITPAS
jgi:hypothetical protein